MDESYGTYVADDEYLDTHDYDDDTDDDTNSNTGGAINDAIHTKITILSLSKT